MTIERLVLSVEAGGRGRRLHRRGTVAIRLRLLRRVGVEVDEAAVAGGDGELERVGPNVVPTKRRSEQIGRASCRERV